jgi:hypothetical protein
MRLGKLYPAKKFYSAGILLLSLIELAEKFLRVIQAVPRVSFVHIYVVCEAQILQPDPDGLFALFPDRRFGIMRMVRMHVQIDHFATLPIPFI